MKLILTIPASVLLLGALTALPAADQPATPAASSPAPAASATTPAANPAPTTPPRKFTEAEMLQTLGWVAINRTQIGDQLKPFGFTDEEIAELAKGAALALADKDPPFKQSEIGEQFSAYMEAREDKAQAKQHADIEVKAAAGDPEAKAFLDQEKTDKAAAEKLAAAGATAKADGAKFLADIKQKKGVMALDVDGGEILYEILQPGAGAYPKATDIVKVNYKGTFINGDKFDASADHDGGKPAEFPLNGVIKGWTEGLQKINKGGKIKLYIPYTLAYGAEGQPPVIPPNSALVFEVELLDINPPADADKK